MDRRTVILTVGAFLTGSSNLARSMASPPPLPGPAPTPPSPVPPTSGTTGIFTANLAFQDPMGGTNAGPNYESVHLMADGRIASIGWIGMHATDFSNAIYAFNPDANTVDLLAPWEQYISAKDLRPKIPPVRAAGYNKHCSTHDNHPSAYFAATNTLVWFGHCVFDVTNKKYIRGD